MYRTTKLPEHTRDNSMWTRDKKLSKVKHNPDASQHGVNYIIEAFQHRQNLKTTDFHLTVGKHRF